VSLLVLVATAGCGGAASIVDDPRPRVVFLQRDHTATQGLLVERDRDILLVTLEGKPYARVVGARRWWLTGDTPRTAPFKALAEAIPSRTILAGPRGRWFVWHADRLQPLPRPRLRLGAITAVARLRDVDDTAGFEVEISILRAGRIVVPASQDLRVVSKELVATPTYAIDVRTGTRWTLQRNCVPGGAKGGELFVLCPSARPFAYHLFALSAAGRRRRLAKLPTSMFATTAMLSPNGTYMAANLSYGCGPSHSFVIPVRGGPAKPIAGDWPSHTLGWTPDSRLVAIVERPAGCDSASKSGVYSIDPRTRERTFVYPKASAMWQRSRG
jgi:hypothetical protein